MGIRKQAFDSAFSVLKGTGLGRFLSPFTQGFGAVFMMHRVLPPRRDLFQPNKHLEISPDFLRSAINRIRENGYEIIPLDEAVELIKSGHGNQRYAVLTFDDGYRDNLELAYPILKEQGVPFTIFVTSGLIDREALPWWIVLEKVIAENDEVTFSSNAGGSGIRCKSVDEKLTCFSKLLNHLGSEVSEFEQRAICGALAERYDIDAAALVDSLMMTWDDVRSLASDNLVTIGAHSHQHYAMARLEETEAREDVVTGVKRLEQELRLRPRNFAYPYGKALAVGQRDADIVREIGFASAVTTRPGVLQAGTSRDPMLLPRVSLNGEFQDPAVVDQYLTGAPFALYRAARWAATGFGIKSRFSRFFPSTK